MEVRFVEVKSGKHHARELPCLVGRGDDACFRLKNDTVSRHHCTFTLEDGVVHVTDLGSTNGTALGAEKLAAQAKTRVPSGAHVRIGGIVLRVEYSAAAQGTGDHAGDETLPLREAAADSVQLLVRADDSAPASSPEPTPIAAAPPPKPVAPVEEPVARPPADVPAFADIDAAAQPAADAAPFPDVEPASAPADGSFDFLGGDAEAPPAADDTLDDFFKSLS